MHELIPTYVQDSREQRPWKIDAFPMTVDTLWAGDYGIVGHSTPERPRFVVERKSLPDLIGSLSKGRKRFEREMQRLRLFSFAGLIIEAERVEVEINNYRSAMSPKAVLASLDAFSVRHGLHVYWEGNAEGGARRFESLVRQYMRGVVGEYEALRKGAA